MSASDRDNSVADEPNGSRCPCEASKKLQAARAGSTAALGQLLQEYRDYLLTLAQTEIPSDIRPKVAASDIVQETLVEGLVGFPQCEGQEPRQFQNWLAAILRRNVLDAVNRFRLTAKRDVRLELPLDKSDAQFRLAGQLVADDRSPSSILQLEETCDALATAIEHLSAVDRAVVILRNFECRSFAEIGELLGVSADAARKRWKRTVEGLSNQLAPLQGSSIRERPRNQ